MITMQVERIPKELRDHPQWVTWQYLDGQKVPFSARTGKAASSTDPTTWAAFDTAYRASQYRRHAGIGYVFTVDDPYVGVDLDDCFDASGMLLPQAQEIIARLNTYAEISPSGMGVKLIARGGIPKNVTPTPLGDGMHIELYDHARYFTITGNHLAGTPMTINDAGEELTQLYTLLRPTPKLPPPETQRSTLSVQADADELRRWCLAALTYEREKMLAAQEGERHHRRYASAHALGGLVHSGGLTEQEIFDALDVNHGPNVANARTTIWDGITAGKAHPREIPPRGVPNTQGDEMRDDDLDDLDADELRRRLRTVTAERDAWRRKFEQLDQWRAWALRVARLETEKLSPAAKVAAFTLWPELQSRSKRGVAEPAPIWIEDFAQRAGLSPGTYGKKLKELAEVGGIVRQETKDPATGHSRVLIAPAGFAHPDTWAPSAPRNHGGERDPDHHLAPACATCGPEAPVVEERSVVTRSLCGSCDTELSEPSFSQTRTTIWPSNRHRAGCSAALDHEAANQQVAGWLATPADVTANPHIAGLVLPCASVPARANWDLPSPATEHTGADHAGHPAPRGMAQAVLSSLDGVAILPTFGPG